MNASCAFLDRLCAAYEVARNMCVAFNKRGQIQSPRGQKHLSAQLVQCKQSKVCPLFSLHDFTLYLLNVITS